MSIPGYAQYRELAELEVPAISTRLTRSNIEIHFEEPDVFAYDWDHFECHVDSIDLSLSEDTIHLNWVDSRHGDFNMPHEGELRSTFGWRGRRYHYGVDLKLNTGDTVYSAFDGKIRFARYNSGGYGNLVVVRHYNGMETYYAHLSRFLVDTNEYVRSGQAIGLGGSTGRSSGPHLHFEVRYMGNAIDPEEVIDFHSGELVAKEMDVTSELFKYKKEMRSRKFHRVRSGDTLTGLANRYHTSVNSICRLNGISRNSVIRIGQNLRVR